MTPIEELRRQLEVYSKLRHQYDRPNSLRFACIEDLVLQHGTVFQRSAQAPPIHPIKKACFAQAYRLATKSRYWIYCEGYAVGKIGLAVHHAWVTSRDAPHEAHDLAWEEGTSEDTAYIGIPFQAKFIRKTHLASKREFYSVLDTWWLNYPLLTGKTHIEDVVWTGDK